MSATDFEVLKFDVNVTSEKIFDAYLFFFLSIDEVKTNVKIESPEYMYFVKYSRKLFKM